MTIDKNDMQAQQARADAILANFAVGVNEATGLPTIETPGYVVIPANTASLIESAEILKRAIVEAEQALEVELAPMRAKLKEAEDALRAKALEQGETIKGAHIQVQIVQGGPKTTWDTKALIGAIAMLPENWRDALLAHRKIENTPISTRIVYR